MILVTNLVTNFVTKFVTKLVTNLVINLVNQQIGWWVWWCIWWSILWQIWWQIISQSSVTNLCESLVLWFLSRDVFCKFLRPLTVLIPNYKYRCDIIHPLVRYHGRSRRSPAPPSGPLGGSSGLLGGPSGPLGGPSGLLGGPAGPLGGASVSKLLRRE